MCLLIYFKEPSFNSDDVSSVCKLLTFLSGLWVFLLISSFVYFRTIYSKTNSPRSKIMDHTWNPRRLVEALVRGLRTLLAALAAMLSRYARKLEPPKSDKSTETDSDSTGTTLSDGSGNSSSRTSSYETCYGRYRGRYRGLQRAVRPRRYRLVESPCGEYLRVVDTRPTGSPSTQRVAGRLRFPRYRAGRLGGASWVPRRAGGRGDAVGRARRPHVCEHVLYLTAHGSDRAYDSDRVYAPDRASGSDSEES
ncbi:uncharacterized protein [Macrobrachium rosenbergii]|uniref:uncharacterized protein n=1 Tax=Macrobrachium rosenbergii TaxID=79674 RepID=UPI0034D410E9